MSHRGRGLRWGCRRWSRWSSGCGSAGSRHSAFSVSTNYAHIAAGFHRAAKVEGAGLVVYVGHKEHPAVACLHHCRVWEILRDAFRQDKHLMVESRRHTVFRPSRLRGKHNPHPGRRCAVTSTCLHPARINTRDMIAATCLNRALNPISPYAS